MGFELASPQVKSSSCSLGYHRFCLIETITCYDLKYLHVVRAWDVKIVIKTLVSRHLNYAHISMFLTGAVIIWVIDDSFDINQYWQLPVIPASSLLQAR
ncbi:jg9696 [Pararge aegeria aegeria]|uniref:Jg9696 protein n=1 Tax=Pararge aegeria aegeria TaxID=348720 RepID=A0A8S4S8Q6_9NEOP|nr:jg9696 [Pararge aegeria aegeria]